jgi:hypothetical protein
MAELKQKQKFEEQWKRLTSLTQDNTPEKAVKVDTNDVVAIFNEISAERVKKAREKFKLKLEGVLEAKLALDKTLQQGKEELAKKEEKEYEVLNKELNDTFQLLLNAKQQGANLVQAASGNFTQPTPEEGKEVVEPTNTTETPQ